MSIEWLGDVIGKAYDEVWEHISAIATAEKAAPLNAHPGLFRFEAGAWHIAVNGHDETIDGCPAYHALLEFHGWPAGIIHPSSGTVAAGDAANVFALRDALKERVRETQ